MARLVETAWIRFGIVVGAIQLYGARKKTLPARGSVVPFIPAGIKEFYRAGVSSPPVSPPVSVPVSSPPVSPPVSSPASSPPGVGVYGGR